MKYLPSLRLLPLFMRWGLKHRGWESGSIRTPWFYQERMSWFYILFKDFSFTFPTESQPQRTK